MASDKTGKKNRFISKLTSLFSAKDVSQSTAVRPPARSNHTAVSMVTPQSSMESIGSSGELLHASQAGQKSKTSENGSKPSADASNAANFKDLISNKVNSIYNKVSQITDSMGDLFGPGSPANLTSGGGSGSSGAYPFEAKKAVSQTPTYTGNSVSTSLRDGKGPRQIIGFSFDLVLTREKATNKRDLRDAQRITTFIWGGTNRILLIRQFLAFLQHNGIKVAIISYNKNKTIWKCLEVAGMVPYIDVIYDKSAIMDHNGFKTSVMKYIINIRGIRDCWTPSLEEAESENNNDNNNYNNNNNKDIITPSVDPRDELNATNAMNEINEMKDGLNLKGVEGDAESKELGEDESCRHVLFVDSSKDVIDYFYEKKVCEAIRVPTDKAAKHGGIEIGDMVIIAKKFGLTFDTREKWYL